MSFLVGGASFSCSVHPTQIIHKQARKVFEIALWVGDNIVEKVR